MPILNDPALAASPITATILDGYQVGIAVNTTAMTAGAAYRVFGSTSEGDTWDVRGGRGVITGDQIVLTDVLVPLNVPVVYRVDAGDASHTTPAITLSLATGNLLTSLDGIISCRFGWRVDGAQREQGPRYASFPIPGSGFPVVRYDRALVGAGSLGARTQGVDTAALDSIVTSGRPVALRTGILIPGIPRAGHILITRAPNTLRSAGQDTRLWDLSYLLVADPEPNTPVPTTTWTEFDEAHALTTWGAFDTTWAGRSWDELDRTVWGQA